MIAGLLKRAAGNNPNTRLVARHSGILCRQSRCDDSNRRAALRVHQHKHYANYPRKKIEDLREARASMSLAN
jgi:hypothetical protein